MPVGTSYIQPPKTGSQVLDRQVLGSSGDGSFARVICDDDEVDVRDLASTTMRLFRCTDELDGNDTLRELKGASSRMSHICLVTPMLRMVLALGTRREIELRFSCASEIRSSQ